MAFRKKADLISAHQPDVLIIPECEHPEKLIFTTDHFKPTSTLWFGKNRNKGLAIFSFGNLKLKLIKDHNEDFKMIIPIRVTGSKTPFNLFAIWAYNPDDKDGVYVTQVWKAVNHYKHLIKNIPAILIGDFNSNTIWDKKNRIDTHSSLVNELKKMGVESTYHVHHKQEHGKEEHPTFYLYKHADKPYHLDYCFASKKFMKKLINVEVGSHQEWQKHSDHSPLIITFND